MIYQVILARDHPLAPRLAPQKAPPKAFDLWPRWSHSRPEIPGEYIKPVVPKISPMFGNVKELSELRASGPVRKHI